MANHDIHRCATCGRNEYEHSMIEYNDRFYCGISCYLQQKRKDDAELSRLDCASDTVYVGKRKPLP